MFKSLDIKLLSRERGINRQTGSTMTKVGVEDEVGAQGQGATGSVGFLYVVVA